MKNFIFFLALIVSILFANGAHVDTVSIYVECMKKDTKICIVTPDTYKENGEKLPVLYLLHGYSGNYATWVNGFPQLPKDADQYNMIIVCADGGYSSWYFDSPIDSTMKYETYITKELVPYIDQNYNTIANRSGRAISGLSMGGHGALWLSFRHKDVFGAAGSTSGGVDIRPFPDNWEMKKQLGEKSQNPELWDKYTVINQIDKIKNGDLALIIDCGYKDFFFEVNNSLHEKLLVNKIDHDYLVRPGMHNGPYWNNSIDYQILFFLKYFSKYNN